MADADDALSAKKRKIERNKIWRANNRQHINEYNRRRNKTRRKEERERRKRWKKLNPEKFKEKTRRYRKKYAADIRNRTRKLRGYPKPDRPEPTNCECCGRKPSNKALHLDHCHLTGAFRGWLCNRCNLGIGQLGDTENDLRNALRYLMKAASPPANETPQD